MNFNSKAILTALMILVCGFCADGHAKSKKSKKKHYDTPIYVEPAQKVEQTPVKKQEPAKEVVVITPPATQKQEPAKEVVEITPPAKIEVTPTPVAIVEEKVETVVVAEPEVVAAPVIADHECEELHEHVAEHAEINEDAELAS